MNKVLFERPRELRRRDGAVYACTDGAYFYCGYKVLKIDEGTTRKMGLRGTITAPRNGILPRSGKPPTAIVSGTLMSRDMKKIISGGPGKTCTLPSTTITVGKSAF